MCVPGCQSVFCFLYLSSSLPRLSTLGVFHGRPDAGAQSSDLDDLRFLRLRFGLRSDFRGPGAICLIRFCLCVCQAVCLWLRLRPSLLPLSQQGSLCQVCTKGNGPAAIIGHCVPVCGRSSSGSSGVWVLVRGGAAEPTPLGRSSAATPGRSAPPMNRRTGACLRPPHVALGAAAPPGAFEAPPRLHCQCGGQAKFRRPTAAVVALPARAGRAPARRARTR